MSSRTAQLWHALKYCGDCVVTLACWLCWVLLAGLAAVQIGIASSHELAVPDFVLRSLEARITASHVLPRFGRTTFDPSGKILLEHVQLSLPEFAEPVAVARAVYLDLDPWLLLVGRIEPRRISATGVTLFTPAMLSPSGRSEQIVQDLELVLRPGEEQLQIDQFATHFAGIAVTAHGALHLEPRREQADVAPLPLLSAFARNFAGYTRQVVRVAEKISVLEQPSVEVALSPSTTRGAIANVEITARALQLPQVHELAASGIRVLARFPLLGETASMSPLSISAADVRTRGGVSLQDVHARLRGALTPSPFAYVPRELEFTARQVSARGLVVRSLAGVAQPTALPDLEGFLLGELAGAGLAIDGRVRFTEKSAAVHVDGALSPTLLEPIGKFIGRDVRPFIGFGEPVQLDAIVTFAPGWRFEQLAGRVAARAIDAYHVPIDAARGDITFDGRRFVARNAVAVLGENVARGSFEQDLSTRDFRFLLDGRLRPLDISGWFREWWPNFFTNFEFPSAPPNASVDVRGRWHLGHETTVFIFAESAGPVIRGAALDYARTLIFVRPNFLDGFELVGRRGANDLRGSFVRHVAVPDYRWREMDLALTSTLDLETGAKLLGPELGAQLAPFTFETPPRVTVAAHFDGPGSSAGVHQSMRIDAQSTGDFTIYRFPARNLTFSAVVRDDELTLERVEASIADGVLSGNAKLWGADADRRLGFDASLRGASLGQVATTISRYAAQRRGQETTAPEKILPGKNNVRLDLALSAEGKFQDPFSYVGNGNASLEGAGLGEVRLLGLLSALLDFTALRFTSARAEFRVEGPKVVFPSINITGANSAIHAHGDYSLTKRQLDFNARVYPFEESKSLIQSVVGAVLSPISTMLEVKLTGPLDEPSWAFVIGPTNLLRSLSQSSSPTPGAPATPPSPPKTPAVEETH